MKLWENKQLDPEELTSSICLKPGIEIEELIDGLKVPPNQLYKALKKLQGDDRICLDGSFKISCFDGPLTYERLDAILEEAMMKRGDVTKAVRLNLILDLLNVKTPYGGDTLKELAEKCQVVEKSVRRYIETLENQMGYKILRRDRPGKPTLFLLDQVYLSPISPEKAIIIFLSLLQQKGTALSGHINAIKDALITQLFKNRYRPEGLGVEQLQERIYFIEEALSDPVQVGELFGKLINALRENHRVKIWYFTASRGEVSERVVEPYGLICKRHNWYLVGFCHKSREIRTFRVDQIRDIHPYVSEKFTFPGDFTLKQHMGNAWGVIRDDQVHRVKLKFKSALAHLPRTVIYHPSQRLEEELEDGSLVVTYEVCGLAELKSWVIHWSDNVEVLEPAVLREKVRETALKIAELYDK